MTTRNPASLAGVPITLFCGPSVDDRREVLSSELTAVDGLSVTAVRPLSALDDTDATRPVLVVSDTPPPAPLPDQRTVWVTTDPTVAERVADEAAVVHWGFGDDWEMLATRLRAEFDAREPHTDPTARRMALRAYERIDDVVLSLDTDHRLTYLDERAAGLFDTAVEDLYGERLWEHVPHTVTEDLRPSVERAMAAGEQVTTPFDLDDGTQLQAATVYPGPDGVTLRTQDIEDDSSPSLYEYLVETVGDAVYILDDDGHFAFVNDALCEMTGYSREELLGSSVHIIKDDETVEEAEDALRELLKTRAGTPSTDGIDIAKLDVELVRKDGTRIPCTDRMTLRPLEDGEFTGTVGTLRDVSRQRRRVNILNGLVERSRAMMSATETGTVTDMIVRVATEVFGLDLVALRKYDPDVDGLVPVATSAALEAIAGERPVYDTDEGPVGTAFTSGDLVTQDNLGANADADITAVDHGAYLPIGDQYVLSLGHSDDEGFDSITLGLLEVFGETAAAAIERVTREEHLKQYEAIVEAAEDMLFTVDDDRCFTLVTRPFAQLVGHSREELVGRRLDDFLPDDVTEATLSPEDRAVLETEFEGQADTVPTRLALAEFEDGFIGTVQDISQLKSAQREASRQRRRFVELFETLADPVADVSYRDGVASVEDLNPAFAQLCDREPDALKRGTFAAAQEAMPDDLARALDPVGSPSPSLDTTVTVQTSSGERKYLVRTAPYGSDGTDRAFVLLTDVTELSRRGTQLKVLHRILRHNLRNETALIQGHAEQLRQLPLPDGAEAHIDTILGASDELVNASETSKTVQRVLGFDADEVETVPADEALDRLRSHIDRSMDPTDTEITVAAATEAAVPFSQYLLVVLRELVENAVEHDPATQVTVRGTARDGAVRLAVSDDGDGLPKAQWELLTGDQEITQLQHGDGLGLWLVKWVTNRHGGYLELAEAGADGTTVELVFPEAT